MRIFSAVLLSLCTTMLLGVLSPIVRANEWNKRTIVTFQEPVEIPGHVLLPGTYVFSLDDTLSDRNVVEVWSHDDMRLVAIVDTAPATRIEPAGKTIFTFEKRNAHAPEAIKDWFYPGDLDGQEFVYPTSPAHSSSSSSSSSALK